MSKGLMIRGNSTRIVTVLCIVAASFLLASPSSFACSCAPYPADEAKAVAIAYNRADAVFVGEVTAVKLKFGLPLTVRDATFDVTDSWKGLGSNEGTVVRSAVGEMACGFKFRKRSRYLVFANWDPDKGILWTNMCELTRTESSAQGLINELNTLTQR